MRENPWIQRVLGDLAAEQQKSDDLQLTGIEEWQLRELLQPEEGSEDMVAYGDALNQLLAAGLIETTTFDGLSLTDAGWTEVAGSAPGSERTLPFLRELVRMYRGTNPLATNQYADLSSVYTGLDWPFNVAQALNIAKRLERAGLVEYIIYSSGGAAKPTYQGFQRVEQQPEVLQ